jgi:subtilase family serine protease
MRTQPIKLLVLSTFGLLISAASFAQTNSARVRITQPVDETKLTVLHGNVHPLARAQFDRGAAPYSLPMERMQLLLKRSPEREDALETLMAQQQDKSSPNYHHWLTPEEFGSQFGPSDQDIQTITSWLESHGFQVGNVSKGRTVIEFSGDAAQVQEAFHTPIHSFVVNGIHHWANLNDPAIPTALTPVVAGVSSLHNFLPRRMSRAINARARSARGSTRGLAMPQFTYTDTQNNTNFALGPTDFATIYNLLPLWNTGIDGTGETIAVVNDSNINIQDVRDFRSIFGLPAKDPTVTVNGTDPGVQLNGDEIEALLDVEWSGAVAKNATINLVVSASTNASFGGDLSANFVINETPPPPVLSNSFGACELALGTAQNAMYNSMWQQAAAEGITVVVSTGDTGSAGCDSTLAQTGLAVNGLASTPFNVAVGGTDFDDFNDASLFWNTTNTAGTQASAKSYIPETTWNDTCTNVVVYATIFSFSNATTACSSTQLQGNNQFGIDFTLPVGASGGKSNCTVNSTTSSTTTLDPTSCTGGYAKPSWQVGVTPGGDLTRDLPDVSLFAGDGLISGSFYVLCERDQQGPTSTTSAACNLSTGAFLGIGGTSVSTQAFAGVMALVDQKAGSKQGNANMVLYPLFTAQGGSSCNTNGPPAATCIFNDVSSGTIAMPCAAGSPNCNSGAFSFGVLSGFDAGTGYDSATGLGSVNIANLVNAPSVWTSSTSGADFTLSVSPSAVTVARGSTGTVTLTVTAEGGFTGTVTPSCSALPTGVTCSGPAVMGGGSSTITLTASSSAMLAPANRPSFYAGLTGPSGMAILLALCALGAAFIPLSYRRLRWRSAAVLATAAFALLVVSAGCSGNPNSSNNGGGGGTGATGTSNVVITATSGNIQRSVAVSLTID